MGVIAVGTDIIEVGRVADALDRHERLEARLFTVLESGYCRSKASASQHFAARFAAKEAVIKVIGDRRGVRWRDIEVVRSSAGAPSVLLHGHAAEKAAALGVTRIHLSLSHTAGYATALAVAEGDAT